MVAFLCSYYLAVGCSVGVLLLGNKEPFLFFVLQMHQVLGNDSLILVTETSVNLGSVFAQYHLTVRQSPCNVVD